MHPSVVHNGLMFCHLGDIGRDLGIPYLRVGEGKVDDFRPPEWLVIGGRRNPQKFESRVCYTDCMDNVLGFIIPLGLVVGSFTLMNGVELLGEQ